MRKTHISTAVLLALALPIATQAQGVPTPLSVTVGTDTTLTLSGLLAAGVKMSTVTDTTRPVQTLTRVDDNTSRFTIGGRSDFGDGLRGVFRVESRFTTDDRPGTALAPGSSTNVAGATGWADGDTWVGLAGSFGQVVVGKSSLYYSDTLAMPYFGINGAGESYRAWDGNGLATFNLLSQVGTATAPVATMGITRAQNVIRYDAPQLGKFGATVAYSPNSSGDEPHYTSCYASLTTTTSTVNGCSAGSNYGSGQTIYGRVTYNDGPLTSSLSLLNQQVAGGLYNPAATAGPLNTNAYRLGVGYAMDNGVRLGFVYDNTSIANAVGGPTGGQTAQRGVISLPVSYAWDKHQVYFTYTVAGATSNIDSSGATQYNLGWDYALSKSTFLGVFYTRLKNDTNGTYSPFLSGTSLGGDAVLKGEGSQQLSLDINYWF
jgi:predicted porin